MARRAIKELYSELGLLRQELSVLQQQIRSSTRARLVLDALVPEKTGQENQPFTLSVTEAGMEMAAADKMEVKSSYSLPSSEVNRYVTEPVITATPAALVGLENLHGEFHGDLMKSQCNGEDQEELIEEIQTDPFPDMGTYIVLAPAQAAAATSPSAAPTTTTSDQAPGTEPGTDDARAGRPPLASVQEDAVPGPDIVDSAVTYA
ncbi:unnamed protein product, partial [Prorocentrum cordatum]